MISDIKHHKIIIVTPAGRKRYLQILSNYILKDDSIDEWHLWDNCRNEADRKYITELSEKNDKIILVHEDGTDGTNRSVNRFYKYCRDENAFYIKMDDDIVYLPEKFGMSMYSKALKERGDFCWWSPLVINNAICSYLFKSKKIITTNSSLTAQASCSIGWGSPFFAEHLHRAFLKSLNNLNYERWILEDDYDVFLQRFSINTIGFFGEFSKNLGDDFCPSDVDDEEYISATLPILTDKPGRLLGDIIVSHFSYYTQEKYLLSTDILQEYANIAEVKNYSKETNNIKIKKIGYLSHHSKQIIKYNAKYILNDMFGFYLKKQKGIKIKLSKD